MLTIHNPEHRRHQGRQEMFRGRLVPCVETPARLDHVLAELQRRALGPLSTPPADLPGLDAALARVHTPRYLRYLATAWDEWLAADPANAAFDVLPSVWPAPGMRRDVLPRNFSARVGLFSFDAGTPLTAGSWAAARVGAACALTAARALAGRDMSSAFANGDVRSAFALSRPPGHHAGADFCGGYCFLNNAAIAAQALRDLAAERVAILDIDYHHGNGTQDIFYERADVLTLSIHGDPQTEYPFYLGHADERGDGAGLGFNRNLPLPRGSDFATWRAALREALSEVARFRPEALVVPLGVDTFEGDPISGFTLRSADYFEIGAELAGAGVPTLFVFEGGYAVAEIGVNAVNVLEGFINRPPRPR